VNCLRAAAMRPYAKLLLPLVNPFWIFFYTNSLASDVHEILFVNIRNVTLLTLLWSPYGIGQTIIFLPCGFFLRLSFFIPRLISAVAHWMSAILPQMVWP